MKCIKEMFVKSVSKELFIFFMWNVLGDKLEFVFSPDVILCGWLGSKHQLINQPTKQNLVQNTLGFIEHTNLFQVVKSFLRKAEICKLEFQAAGEVCKAIFWPIPGLKDKTFNSSRSRSQGTLISAFAVPHRFTVYQDN